MKILVTGGGGTIGKALREFLPDALYLSRQECDVTNDRQLNEVFQREQPDAVIHAAAITDHQHPNAAEIIQTNIMGTELVARYCRAFGVKLVYLSTHYVYPGETGNYKETDETRPIGTYAWSKLAGEGWARLPESWLIVRGSWYTEEKLEAWRDHAVYDACCSRERPSEAASKIAALIRRGASGICNIGYRGENCRTFTDILRDEGLVYRALAVSSSIPTPYPFPRACCVNTDKYEAFVRGT